MSPSDIFMDEDREDIRQFLIRTKLEGKFLVIEDRKFADICMTNIKQMEALKVMNYADIIICHAITGFEFINHIKLPVLLVAELSNKGNLISPEYTRECVKALSRNRKIIGCISQSNLGYNKAIYCKPGTKIDSDIQLNNDKKSYNNSEIEEECCKILKRRDKYDQKYTGKTPGIDFYIIGRAITQAEDIEKECLRHKEYFN